MYCLTGPHLGSQILRILHSASAQVARHLKNMYLCIHVSMYLCIHVCMWTFASVVSSLSLAPFLSGGCRLAFGFYIVSSKFSFSSHYCALFCQCLLSPLLVRFICVYVCSSSVVSLPTSSVFPKATGRVGGGRGWSRARDKKKLNYTIL